jgi:signal transduction histidine kinase
MILLFLGVMLVQIMNMMIRWKQQRHREYFLYAVYLSVFFIYLVQLFADEFLTELQYNRISSFTQAISRPIAILLYILYNRFIVTFLDLKTVRPKFYRSLKWYTRILLFSVFNQFLLQHFLKDNPDLQNAIYGVFMLLLFCVNVYIIYQLWRTSNELSHYILKGTICLTVGVFITNILNLLLINGMFANGPWYFYPALLGIGFEIYFFNNGLFYKTSKDEKELIQTQQKLIVEMKQNEQLLVERQSMRNKIAKDLHDDVGATLSGIVMHSHLSTQNIQEHKQEAVLSSLKLIQDSAYGMVGRLSDIVWTVNPMHDELAKIIERLQEYAFTVAVAKGIEVQIQNNLNQQTVKLLMNQRKSIYLIAKEAINNAVKYSEATQLTITVEQVNGTFMLEVADNGKGFDVQHVKKGNGLINIEERAAEISADLKVHSVEGKGTTVSIFHKIPQLGD